MRTEKQRKYDRWYNRSPAGRAAAKKYRESAKGRRSLRERSKRYRSTVKGAVKHRIAARRYIARHPEKKRARDLLHYAVTSGKVIPEPCMICGNKYGEAHHDDYSKPFDVVWLCNRHHMELHKKRGY